MIELKKKANNFAEENILEVLKEACSKVYAEGYRDGYKDRDAEISVDLRDNKTEYVDLGLPSGTLWAVDYEKEGNDIIYLPYDKASQFDIPTEEQCNELLSLCRWESIGINSYSGKFDCVGPNGKIITFKSTGFYKVDSKDCHQNIYFWLKDQSENLDKAIAFMRYYNLAEDVRTVKKKFMGFKLPVRLVKTR